MILCLTHVLHKLGLSEFCKNALQLFCGIFRTWHPKALDMTCQLKAVANLGSMYHITELSSRPQAISGGRRPSNLEMLPSMGEVTV